MATLSDCRPMRPEDEAAAGCPFVPSVYAWVLSDVRKLEPFPVKGARGLYDVEMPSLSKRAAQEDLRRLFPLSMFGGMGESHMTWRVAAYEPDWVEITHLKAFFMVKHANMNEGPKYFVFFGWRPGLEVPLHGSGEPELPGMEKAFKTTSFEMTLEQLESNKIGRAHV